MKRLLIFFNFLLLLGAAVNSFAFSGPEASGTIRGLVTDGTTGEPLIAANIAIEGTGFGTATNLNGEYTITGIPAGTYTVLYRYIGYKDHNEEQVRVSSGETVELNIVLSPEPIAGVEVTILGQARGQMAAINQQRNAMNITNIVSSEKIRDVPDANAAESIGRLPGVSLRRSGGEGNQIVVRGLSPQYTIVEVDGVRLQGIGLGRDVGLSMISSEMLDGIELSKSLTADKDADAIGGVVNLRTRTAKEGFHFDLLTQGGYNNLENSLKNYKYAANVSNRFFKNKLGIIASGSTEQVFRSSDRYSAGYREELFPVDTVDGEVIYNHNYYTANENIRENKKLRHRNHGGLVLDYKSDFMTIKVNNTYSWMLDENEERNNQLRYSNQDFRHLISDSDPVESIQTHSLSSVFNIFTTQLSVDAQYSRTRQNSSSDRYVFEDNYATPDVIEPDTTLFAEPYSLINLFDLSTGAQSYLDQNVRNTTMRDDLTKRVNVNWKVPFTLSQMISGKVKLGGSYSVKERSSDTEEYWSYYFGGIGGDRADRVFANNPDFYHYTEPEYLPGKTMPGVNFIDTDYDYGSVLGGETNWEPGWSADLDKLKEVHDYFGVDANGNPLYPDDQTYGRGVQSSSQDYQNKEEYMAGYVMAEILIGKRLLLLPGVRYEKMTTTYTANYVVANDFDPTGIMVGYPEEITVSDRMNQNFFPSLNMKFDITNWMDVRAAYYKSTSRPSYRLLSPGMISNFDKDKITAFNPYLNPALAHNYDLGVSFFDNKLGLLTFNIFYKQLNELLYNLPDYNNSYFDLAEGVPESLMESLEAPRHLYREDLFNDLTGIAIMNNYPINNPNPATFYGAEVSWTTNFWYLPGLLRGLVLDLNYSYIRSATEFPYLNIYTTFTDDFPIPKKITHVEYETLEGSMLDQPKSLYNARIGWDYKGFSTRLSFRYQGETLQGLDPLSPNKHRYKNDYFRVDLQMKQKILDGLSVYLDIANLTSAKDRQYMYASGYNLPSSIEHYGMTAQFSLRYEF